MKDTSRTSGPAIWVVTIGITTMLLVVATKALWLVVPFLLAIIHTIGLTTISPTVYIFSAFFIAILAGVICYLVLERRVLRVARRLIKRTQPMR